MRPSRIDPIFGIVRSLRRLDPRPDAELIARFLDHRDETAFEALVFRHTSAVRAACRGWLRIPADIDDASQATFLVLARRAGAIRDRAAVGPWLYGVASNIARRLRQQRSRFGTLTEDVPSRTRSADDELADVLAAEVARLPEKYRLPVQLCYASGLTTADAAMRLGWAKGTVLTRLAWARRRLQKTLTRLGFAPGSAQIAVPTAPAVTTSWMCSTAQAAIAHFAGRTPAEAELSARVILLAEGVLKAMVWSKIKFAALGVLVAAGLVGTGIGRWSTAKADASDKPEPHAAQRSISNDSDPVARTDNAKPDSVGRRREVTIRLPSGPYVKEVEVAPYGSGRMSWNYEDDRVVGLIEGSVMGGEFELATEAEYSLSSTGVIYGVLTSVRLNHLKLPEIGEFAELKPFAGLWSAVEPLVNEVTADLPFSYRFKVQGDRLVISNFRILLAGPNPLGKLGGLTADADGIGAVLTAFQAFGTALEGTYTSAEANAKPAPAKRPLFRKPGGADASKPGFKFNASPK